MKQKSKKKKREKEKIHGIPNERKMNGKKQQQHHLTMWQHFEQEYETEQNDDDSNKTITK